MREAKGKIDNVTIGRTDLSSSYFDSKITPDSEFIFDLVERLSSKVYAAGLALTVGGSITKDSIGKLKECRGGWVDRLCSIETRKIVLPVIACKANNENPSNKIPICISENRFHLLLTVSHFLFIKS